MKINWKFVIVHTVMALFALIGVAAAVFDIVFFKELIALLPLYWN